MATKKKAQAPPPSPVRRKQDEGHYRFRRSAFARARKSLDRIRIEGAENAETLTAGEKARSAFVSMRKGVKYALMMKRALEAEADASARSADAGKGITVGHLLRRGSRDVRMGQGWHGATGFGGILPEETASSSWKDGLFGLGGGTSSMAEGEARQGRRPSGSNPLLQLSIFGARTSTAPIEPLESTETDQTRPRRKQRRGKEDGQKGDPENELENKQDSKRDRRRRRRKGHEESGCGDSDEKEVDQEITPHGHRRRRARRKDKTVEDSDDSPHAENVKSQETRRRRAGRRGAGSHAGDGTLDSEKSQDESCSEDSYSYSNDSADSNSDGSDAEKSEKRYLIPNSSQVSLETAKSSHFLPRCAQSSLFFGQRRTARRPGVELRQVEATGLAARRRQLELEMRDCLLELQAGCDELSDSAAFGWPGKELERLHHLCRCAVDGLCDVYKELLAAERPRTPQGLQQEQAQLHEMLRLCRKAVRRVAELRRLCRSKDWKWLKTHAPWEQLAAPLASPRTVRATPKKPFPCLAESLAEDPALPWIGLEGGAPWHTASVASIASIASVDSGAFFGGQGLSSTLSGSTASLRTWNDDLRLFPEFCQDTLQEAGQSRDRWSQEKERKSLCGPYQTGQCSARCPFGLQHRCVHCRGRHAAKDCRPTKVVRSVAPRKKPGPSLNVVSEVRQRNATFGRRRGMERMSGGSSSEDLEICGTMDHRYLQANLVKRASMAVKSLMLLLARLPSAARVDDFPRLEGFVRSFEDQERRKKAKEPKELKQTEGDSRLQAVSFHLRRGMARI